MDTMSTHNIDQKAGEGFGYRFRTAVVTLSDSSAAGGREDKSGPLIGEILEEAGGYEIISYDLLPDDPDRLTALLIKLADEGGADLILTTGGTGFSPRDFTPEATMAAATRNAPGISEYMRMKSAEITPKAMLSRGVSVIRNQTLIINLPGSPKAVRENLSVILPALSHGLEILLGRTGDCAVK